MEVMVRIRGRDAKGVTKYDEQYIKIEDLFNGLNNVMKAELRDDRTELWITDVHEIVLDLLELDIRFAIIDEIKLYP